MLGVDAQRLKQLWYRKQLEEAVSKNSSEHALLLSKVWQDAPLLSSVALDLEYLCVDLEMSSLDPGQGDIISAGWVLIRNRTIELSSAEHHLLEIDGSVGESATIHSIRDCELDDGSPPEAMLSLLLKLARGRVLVFHNADLDIRFLNKLSRSVIGIPLVLRVIDTLFIEKHRLEKSGQPIKRGALKLDTCHSRYSLPSYSAHNALQDALATAELLLAQMSTMSKNSKLRNLTF